MYLEAFRQSISKAICKILVTLKQLISEDGIPREGKNYQWYFAIVFLLGNMSKKQEYICHLKKNF